MSGPIPLTQPVAQPLRRFDKYYLVQKLAEGGMAEIFLAKQVGAEGFERDVVVKCMLEHFTSSPEFVQMFLDEARLAARLFHPNIVQITDLGSADGRYFICMEYLPGEDLQAIIDASAQRATPVPLGIAARIILSALEGLEFAHGYSEGGGAHGLVHRDISPSNIFVTYQGTVKVLDFGIAKASSKLIHTQPGMVKGKLGYMSPEQARGEPLDGRADLFALGVTFHELLTGRRVFQKDNEVGVLMALMQQPIPPPSSVRPEVPPALDRIVLRAMEKDPAARYPNAAAMRADLEAYLSGQASGPGTSHLGTYLQQLFGAEQARRKTQIPSLAELAAKGFVVPPPAEPKLATPAGEDDGFAKTFVRPSNPGLAAMRPGPPVPTAVTAVQPSATPPPQRRGRGLVLALSVVSALCLGAAAAVIAGVPLPFAARTPPPPPPAEVVPPPEAAIEPEQQTAPATEAEAEAGAEETEAAPPPPARERPRQERRVDLGPREIQQAIARRQAALTACVDRFRADVPPSGSVEMVIHITPAGRVSAAAPSDKAIANTALVRCLSGRLRQVRFPKNTSNGIQFKLPMQFEKR